MICGGGDFFATEDTEKHGKIKFISHGRSRTKTKKKKQYSPATSKNSICGVGDRLSKNFVGHGWPERSAHGCARSGFWKACPQPHKAPIWQATEPIPKRRRASKVRRNQSDHV